MKVVQEEERTIIALEKKEALKLLETLESNKHFLEGKEVPFHTLIFSHKFLNWSFEKQEYRKEIEKNHKLYITDKPLEELREEEKEDLGSLGLYKARKKEERDKEVVEGKDFSFTVLKGGRKMDLSEEERLRGIIKLIERRVQVERGSISDLSKLELKARLRDIAITIEDKFLEEEEKKREEKKVNKIEKEEMLRKYISNRTYSPEEAKEMFEELANEIEKVTLDMLEGNINISKEVSEQFSIIAYNHPVYNFCACKRDYKGYKGEPKAWEDISEEEYKELKEKWYVRRYGEKNE